MNYTVIWRAFAAAQLRAIWLREADREQVADAADAVDRVLRDAPHEQGESRDRATRRLWYQRPLCVLFEIDHTARVVYVGAVRWVGA